MMLIEFEFETETRYTIVITDGVIAWSAEPLTEITGFDHLDGETVVVLE